jgi:hypothetical protein
MSLDIELHNLKGFTEEEKVKFKRALILFKEVVNSQEFELEIKSNKGFRETGGMTNKQIYDHFMAGKDSGVLDNDIDVYAVMFYSSSSTIGYTISSSWWIWINRKFFKVFDESGIVGNLSHEYCHNIGWRHKIYFGRSRTVPYTIGYIARDLCKKLLNGQKLTPRSIDNITDKNITRGSYSSIQTAESL